MWCYTGYAVWVSREISFPLISDEEIVFTELKRLHMFIYYITYMTFSFHYEA